MKTKLRQLAEAMFELKTNQYHIAGNKTRNRMASRKCIYAAIKLDDKWHNQSLKIKSFFALILAESL